MHYPTQKSEELLAWVLNLSSDEGNLVADFFCVRKGTLVMIPLTSPLFPPACGGMKGGLNGVIEEGTEAGQEITDMTCSFKPIESLQIGDYVIGHTGKPHKVLRTFSRRYSGRMVRIQTENSDKALYLTEDHRVLAKRKVQRLSNNGGWSSIPSNHFQRARELRNEATFPERKLWRCLSGNKAGVKFRRQHPIGPYIADFYSRQAGLVVEIDGNFAHSSMEQIEHDHIRDQYMMSMGLNVLRISAKEANENIEGVFAEINNLCKEHVLPDDPEKQWRFAKNLKPGDIVFSGFDLKSVGVASIDIIDSDEGVFDIEVEDSHSFITNICAIHNCGSGTTVVAPTKCRQSDY